MMRALWSAASGMIGQQSNVDTISNNVANVNTTGYKTEKAEFKSLLYQTIQEETTSANGETKPINAQIGLGSRLASVTSNFSQGTLLADESNTAFAIEGEGLFSVRTQDGELAYTRNGNFNWGIGTEGVTLADSDGNPVLDDTGNTIVLPDGITATSVKFDANSGGFYYLDNEDKPVTLDLNIGLWQFDNRSGLEKIGSSLYMETAASGGPINEATDDNLTKSGIKSNYLEGSNVEIADEMVNLIVAQRAYEMNSKAIQAADTMLGQANNLRS